MRSAIAPRNSALATSKPRSAPPPVGGLNARDSLLDMPPTDARILINALPRPGEIEIRKGAADHATGLPDDVETLMSYTPPSGAAKLFAATETDIYDVTTAGAVGTAAVSTLTSGKWQYASFANSANVWMIAVNGADEMQVYNGSTWSSTATFDFGAGTIDTSAFIDVAVYQKRLFFLAKDSRSIYFLPAGAISGTCQRLEFEQLMKRGGKLQAIGSWSVDAGDGLDDLFVAITSEGEAIVYSGIDPSVAADWLLKGVYFVGRPLGQRCLFNLASELFVVTERGLYPMSRALSEASTRRDAFISDKINQVFLNYSTKITRDFFGWQSAISTSDNLLLINVPLKGDYFNQLVMDLTTGGWAIIKGWNALCWHFFDGSLYFGYLTSAGEGRVAKAFVGYLDFPDPVDDTIGTFVKAYVSPSYTSFNQGPLQKHIKLFRPLFLSGTNFQYKVGVSADAATPFPLTTVIGELPGGNSLWNTATWSTTYVWDGLTNITKWWHSVDSYPGSYVSLYLEIENTGKSSIKLLGIDYLLGDGGIL